MSLALGYYRRSKQRRQQRKVLPRRKQLWRGTKERSWTQTYTMSAVSRPYRAPRTLARTRTLTNFTSASACQPLYSSMKALLRGNTRKAPLSPWLAAFTTRGPAEQSWFSTTCRVMASGFKSWLMRGGSHSHPPDHAHELCCPSRHLP